MEKLCHRAFLKNCGSVIQLSFSTQNPQRWFTTGKGAQSAHIPFASVHVKIVLHWFILQNQGNQSNKYTVQAERCLSYLGNFEMTRGPDLGHDLLHIQGRKHVLCLVTDHLHSQLTSRTLRSSQAPANHVQGWTRHHRFFLFSGTVKLQCFTQSITY